MAEVDEQDNDKGTMCGEGDAQTRREQVESPEAEGQSRKERRHEKATQKRAEMETQRVDSNVQNLSETLVVSTHPTTQSDAHKPWALTNKLTALRPRSPPHPIVLDTSSHASRSQIPGPQLTNASSMAVSSSALEERRLRRDCIRSACSTNRNRNRAMRAVALMNPLRTQVTVVWEGLESPLGLVAGGPVAWFRSEAYAPCPSRGIQQRETQTARFLGCGLARRLSRAFS